MKRIFTPFVLIFLLLLTLNTRVHASETVLLPASVVTASGEKWGYIDQSGVFTIKPEYNSAGEFNDKGIAIVAIGNDEYDICKIYFINKSGKVVSGPFTSFIPEFKNGIAILSADNAGSTVVDSSGKVLFKSKNRIYSYQDGLLSFSETDTKYGFMDLNGKVVISANYLSVQDFKDGKAVVETATGKFSVIDKSGKVIEVLKYYNKFNSSEGLTSFYDDKRELYGYKSSNGTVVIKPAFYIAEKFTDGFAVVGVDLQELSTKYGLIDKKGDYILKPEYSGITYLGSGMFSASKNFSAPLSHYYSPKALFNNKGEQLTDFIYYEVDQFEADYSVACDGINTFFIDKAGNTVDKLPRLKGIGNIKRIGSILQAKLDGELIYLKENGEIIWQKDRTIPLSNTINIKTVSFRKDFLTYIEYPQISGLEDSAVEENINKNLKSDFLKGYEGPKPMDDEYPEDISYNFSVSLNKNLLIIKKEGYIYPVGAAHGSPTKDYIYIDTRTGTIYQLKDLFKAGSKYTEKLTSIVNNQMALDTKVGTISGNMYYLESKTKVSYNQHFILGSDSLKIYYVPYEIAAYAAGFPEFEIPYGQLGSIIDTQGAFWNSFDKTVINHKAKLFWNIEDSKVKQIESVIQSYEQNIINAINNNAFSAVEPCLLKGSTLYNSQKKLVSSLYGKNTKEKLNKYEIYAIEQVSDSQLYRVYVLEEVAVKYHGKNYVNNKYNWCYTVKLDNDLKYKLSGIVKW